MSLRLPGIALLVGLVTAGAMDGRGGRAWSDSSKATIKLLEAGAEPRAVLRYRCVKGRKEKGSGSVVTKDLSADRRRPDEKTAVSVTLAVEEITKTLETRYAFTLDTIDVVSKVNKPVTPDDTPKKQEGTVIKVAVDERGRFKSRDFVPPKGAPRSLYPFNAMNDLEYLRPPPFPAEAVGVGARWEVVTDLPRSIWKGKETTVCTLKTRDGNRVELDVGITQSAKPQKFNFGDGIRSQLLSFAGSGSGNFQLDLEGVLPLRGNTTVVTEETHKFTAGDYVEELTQKSERKTELTGALQLPDAK